MERNKTKSISPRLTGVAVVALIVAIGGSVWAVQNNSNTTKTASTSLSVSQVTLNPNQSLQVNSSSISTNKTSEPTAKDSSASSSTAIKAGSYEDYDKSLVANAASGKVVLFFKANWCTTCRALERDIIQNLSKLNPGTTILKVDYDNSTDLKRQYGVNQQHTLVQVDANGTLIKKNIGTPNLEAINTFLN